ncbi:MAG: glycosyltransferase family 4 protein [Candidatus Pacebacteria bacterium]|nr:glycosyltransferase family 4 protein [Candidatus Paceibacterota bacterium]MBP9832173.1 glycosyltransferase family 4 protein [Candidatus Paceibacterota bacterium]
MKVIYVTNARIPTDWAHGLQIMKTCEALVLAGVSLELWTPRKKLFITEPPFSYYDIKIRFPLKRIFTLEWDVLGPIGFFIQTLSFTLGVSMRLPRNNTESFVYCRDEIIVALLVLLGFRNVIWESHSGAWNVWAQVAVKHAWKIVVVSKGLKEFYIAKGVSSEKIFVVPNGIDLSAYEEVYSKEDVRSELGIPQDKKVALYVGMLNGWKGANTLLSASDFLPVDTILAVIGGEDEVLIAGLSKRYSKVLFLGFRESKELARNLASADVLVLSNTAKNAESAHFTSPLKLFAYMASKKPIVLPDLPALREILNDDSAYFVEPDSAEALARGIQEALSSKEDARLRVNKAYERVKEYTWKTRAVRIQSILCSI